MKGNLVKIGLIGLAALASVGIILVASSAAKRMGFFTRAEADFAPINPPKVQPSDDSAIITWSTNKPVVAKINYGTSPTDLTLPAFEADQTTEHEIKLTGLLPEQTYYYEIVVGEQQYRENYSEANDRPYSFKTLPRSRPQTDYPECNLAVFKEKYGANREDPRYDSTYDLNNDGAITTNDFFECIKVNPPQ